MKRRIALLSTAGLSIAAVSAAVAQSPARGRKEQVVIQVSTPEQKLWNQALNYIDNLRELYGPENVELELVVRRQKLTRGDMLPNILDVAGNFDAGKVTLAKARAGGLRRATRRSAPGAPTEPALSRLAPASRELATLAWGELRSDSCDEHEDEARKRAGHKTGHRRRLA